MSSELAIKNRIAQLRSQGKVAEPHTWISATSVTKNGKTYTYYRLLKGFRINSSEDADKSQNKKLKTKMVRYLGTADSEAYQEMKKAIARRNEIQRLLKKLKTLEEQVNADQPKKNRKPRQSALTTLVMELMGLVQNLQDEINSVKLELRQEKNRKSIRNLS